MEAVPANRLGDVRSLMSDVCVIGIDEGQFVSTGFIRVASAALHQMALTCRAIALHTGRSPHVSAFLYFFSFQTSWSFVRRWPI